MEHKERLLKICELVFSITEFDIELFDQHLNPLGYFTHNSYFHSVWACFPEFESELFARLGNCQTSACFWHQVPELELLYLDIRIQVSDCEYYYASVGPAMTISDRELLIRSVSKKLNLPPAKVEDCLLFYQSIPFFHTKTKNLFLTSYHLLTTMTDMELPLTAPESHTRTPVSLLQPLMELNSNDFSPIVKKAVDYIHSYYEQAVTLHRAAASIPCGESHLSRCFHRETGKTFKAYLNEFRIRQAILLLNTGFYRITDVALLVGFSSYTKFSVIFKKLTNMCASDYLAMQHGNVPVKPGE